MNDELIRHEDRWYIAANSSYADDRSWVLNHADTFGVFDRWGDVQVIGTGAQGVYHRDTRYLSRLQLRIEGRRPLLLSSTVREDNAALSCDLANPELDGIHKGMVHVHRNKFVRAGSMYGEIVVSNFDVVDHELAVTLAFGADYRDIFEVRGTPRATRGELLPVRVANDEIMLGYRGLDGILRSTQVRLDPAPHAVAEETAHYRLRLAPGASAVLRYDVAFLEGASRSRLASRDAALGALTRDIEGRRAALPEIVTDNEQFNHWLARSQADLVSLLARTEHGLYPYAGVPWYNTPFGRDGIVCALQMLWLAPELARDALRYLAATQAHESDAFRDAEPGKIFHEIRGGEMAALREVPFARYYGSVDSTPLFVALAGAYLRRSGDLDTVRALWPAIEAALGWIDRDGDRDGDGFVEYARRGETGLFNQGWKDSSDSISHADGALAEPPIALCEVQAYVYAAWREAATIARALGLATRGAELDARAEAMRARFDERFWDEALGCYVLALDGAKRPCRVRSSNAGQCLFTGIALSRRTEALARTMLAPDLFCGWGVRTLSSAAPRYNPMSYHNGSVWPHDNALIALGLARYGHGAAVARIFHGIFDATLYIALQRLPELFCGFDRRAGEGPTAYPVACSPQAWAVATVYMLLEACLHVRVDAVSRCVRFESPRLPDFLRHVRISRWRLGDGFCDLELTRHRNDVGINVEAKPGGWEIVAVK